MAKTTKPSGPGGALAPTNIFGLPDAAKSAAQGSPAAPKSVFGGAVAKVVTTIAAPKGSPNIKELKQAFQAGLATVSDNHTIIAARIFGTIPLADLVALIAASPLKQVKIEFGDSAKNNSLSLSVTSLWTFKEIQLDNLDRVQRRDLARKKPERSKDFTLVYFEEDNQLKVRVVTQAALERAANKFVAPIFPQKDVLIQKMHERALNPNPFALREASIEALSEIAINALPEWLTTEGHDAIKNILNKPASGTFRPQEALKHSIREYLRHNLAPQKFTSGADILNRSVVAMRESFDAAIPADWVFADYLFEAHYFEDFQHVSSGSNAVYLLLCRVLGLLFQVPITLYALPGEELQSELQRSAENPVAWSQIQSRTVYQVARGMALNQLKPAEIKETVNALRNAAKKSLRYGMQTLNRIIPETHRFWEPIRDAMIADVKIPRDHSLSFFQLIYDELTIRLMAETKFVKKLTSPAWQLALGADLPKAYLEYNQDLFRKHLRNYFISGENPDLFEDLKEDEALAERINARLLLDPVLLMSLVYPAEDTYQSIWTGEGQLPNFDLGQPEHFFKFLFMANDFILKSEPNRAVPLYELILDKLETAGEFHWANVISWKIIKCFADLGSIDMIKEMKESIEKDLLGTFFEPLALERKKRVLSEAAQLYLSKDLLPEAVAVLNRLITIIEAEPDPDLDQELLIRAHVIKAEIFEKKNDYKKAENAYGKAQKVAGLNLTEQAKIEGKRAALLLMEMASDEKQRPHAAHRYFEAAQKFRAVALFEECFDACKQAVALWNFKNKKEQAKGGLMLTQLLDLAPYFRVNASMLPEGRFREKQQSLLKKTLDTAQLVAAKLGVVIAKDDKETELDAGLTIDHEHTAVLFHHLLERIAHKAGKSRETMFSLWAQKTPRNFEVKDYQDLTDYFESLFANGEIIVDHHWPKAQSFLQQLDFTEDQVDLFAPPADSANRNASLLQELKTITVDDALLMKTEDFKFSNQLLVDYEPNLPQASLMGMSLGQGLPIVSGVVLGAPAFRMPGMPLSVL